MNAAAVVIRKLKAVIAKLNRQIAVGVRNARKYILELVDAENKLNQLEVAMSKQMYKNSKSEAISKMSGEHIIEYVEPANPFFPAMESYVTPNGQKFLCAEVLRESAKYTDNYRYRIGYRTQEQLIQDYIGFDIR